MKITFSQLLIALILSSVSYSKSTNAQILDKIVSVTIKQPNLEGALKVIEKTAGVKFVYSKSIIKTDKQVSYTGTAQRLDVVLNSILPSEISYQLINDRIVLSNKKTVAADIQPVTPTAAQQAPIKGKVVSDKGEELIGVSITVKGTTTGTVTDVNGNFTLPNVEPTTVLVFKYVGFATQEVTVGAQTELKITLVTQSSSLNEVVVVGYNVVRKSDVTGSVVSVNAEEIRSRPVQNAIQALQGKAAGVDVTSNERPGEVGRVLIRGVRSLSATSNPLYVVDNIPLSAGGIESLNPNDIETMDVLKDASATAIYGSRGANGVIIITTKKGKAGRLALDYVGTTTVENIVDRTDMMNSAEYIEFRRNAYRRVGYLNPAATPATTYPAVPTLADDLRIFGNDTYARANITQGWQNGVFDGNLVPTTNWTDLVKKTGVTSDHILSVSGGTDKVTGYGSFGYLQQQGTQLGQDYKRYTGKANVNITPTKWLSMGVNLNATYSFQNYGFATSNATGPGTLYFAAQGMLPYAVPFDNNGNRINLPGGDITILNPIGEDQYNINLRKVMRVLGSFYTEVTLMKGLKYRLNFGPDFNNNYNGRWQDQNSINRGGGEPGSTNYAQLNQSNRFSYTLDHLLYYNKSIGKHDFGATLLYSSLYNRTETSTMLATKLPYNKQLWYQLNSVSALDAFGTNFVENSLLSYMGRINYSYDNKYLLTASARWDGASQLAPGNKWQFFPSTALAWRLDQEEFIKDVPWINQLKLRLGYGVTGNAAVTEYSTVGVLQTLYYTFGASVQPGYVASDASLANPIGLPNPLLGWERTTQYNLGIDFGFFKGRISGTLDMYKSRTNELLYNTPVNPVLGYTRSLANVGITANRGLELTLNTENIQNQNFKWSSTLNFGINKDKVESLPAGNDYNFVPALVIGSRIQSYYDYKKIGIWQNTPEDLAEMAKFNANIASANSQFRPGSIKVADLNNDYRIDANNDRTVVGFGTPSWNAGITNTFTYKNFDLSAFIFSRWNFTILTGSEALQGRYAQRLVDYWTPTNPTNDYPAPNYGSANGDTYRSSMNYQDGSFVKVRNITLGYVLPNLVAKKLTLSRVRVYLQALNPGLIYSKVDWVDPDLGGSTFNRGFVLGLNVGF
ncbi:SusC/RagA family TonB-linked outer membrane protein [Mucilaginibacter terrae]|uniref:SusC/RagA family TonB-linked outer membrane protein n=1 Tax=Mucilaginibacter terrae TaxID=1955052 RepID=UPI003626F8A0